MGQQLFLLMKRETSRIYLFDRISEQLPWHCQYDFGDYNFFTEQLINKNEKFIPISMLEHRTTISRCK